LFHLASLSQIEVHPKISGLLCGVTLQFLWRELWLNYSRNACILAY